MPTTAFRRLPKRERSAEDAIIADALAIIERRLTRDTTVSNPNMMRDYLRVKYATRNHEIFVAILLDTRHRIIVACELAHGTIDGASVYPREVVRQALKYGAAAVVFAHNHPSGIAEPSVADRTLTERLRGALALVDIRTLDHFVIGGTTCTSFAERGWL